jgi:hypothetical protein
MALWNEINYSRVLQFQRLDSDFYKTENEIIVNTILKTNSYCFFHLYTALSG